MRAFAALVVVSALLSCSVALAQTQPDRERAREAYDRGVKAHQRGDYATAAAEFAKADEIAPSPVALQAALDAAIEADDPVIGAELLERSKRGPVEGALAGSVSRARERLAGRAGQISIRCPDKCMAAIDGKPVDATKPLWVRAGQHAVLMQVGGAEPQQRLVDVSANATVEVAPQPSPAQPAPAPAPAPTPAPEARPEPKPFPIRDAGEKKPASAGGLPPWAFWIGVGATALLGGASVGMGIYTKSEHDKFVSQGCDRAAYAGCTQIARTGDAAQLTTNLLLVGTGVAAVATVVLGVGFVNWEKTGGPRAFVGPGVAGAGWAQPF
jgi:hypothetical protein